MNTFRATFVSLALFTFSSTLQAAQPDIEKPAFSAAPVAREIVAAHNMERSKVGVAPLTWSNVLAETAQSWANALIASGDFAHRKDGRFGENLYEISGAGFSSTPSEVVSAWAAEAADYRYQSNTCTGGMCGHYTQLVWRQTKEVGCGVARDGRREVWVCNYAPFGNVVGEKPY